MSLRDRAERGGGPEIVLTGSLADAQPARIATSDLVDCDDLTPEGQFPEHGEFLEMRRVDDGETVYWECSQALAEVVVDAVDESEGEHALPGTEIDIDMAAKASGGEWRFGLEIDPSRTLMDMDDDD